MSIQRRKTEDITPPEYMHAWTIRNERLGNVETAYKDEIVKVPELRDTDMLIAVMAAGVNFNGVWAALGKPKNVIDQNGDFGDEKQDFMICGSEASGIVCAVGSKVKKFKVGDEVCVGGSQYDANCPFIKEGGDPCLSPSFHIWGYEGNWGAFAQFARVNELQCFSKPAFLSWEEAAVCSATGVTVHRMLTHWEQNKIQPGDTVLIWGGAGGIGSTAIQLTKALGGIPVAVVSTDEKGEFCISIGAKGFINRSKYNHWGNVSGFTQREYRKWLASAVRFRNEIFAITGKNEQPAIVIEHPGASTLPTSLFVCKSGGMVVLCGATSSYMSDVDLRFLWLNQKRIQGSHAGGEQDAIEYLELIEKQKIAPVIDRIFEWHELPQAHKLLQKGDIKGKYVVKVGVK